MPAPSVPHRIANPCAAHETTPAYLTQSGSIRVYVWARDLGDALEDLDDWLEKQGYVSSPLRGGNKVSDAARPTLLRASYAACSGHWFRRGDILEVVRELRIGGDILFQGHPWIVYDADSYGFRIEPYDTKAFGPPTTSGDMGVDFYDDDNTSAVDHFRLVQKPPTPVDPEEWKRQMDFFFPKSTLPKPRPGGGGLLGELSRRVFRKT